MSIETHEGEIVESVGTTVLIKRDDLGEFSAVYYNEEAEKFITVNGIDPDVSNVDCPTRLLIKFVAKTRKRIAPWRAWGLSRAEYIMLCRAYDDDPEDLNAIWRLVAARSKGIILRPFFEKMARQLSDWLTSTYLIYPTPFSMRQISILRRQKEYHELYTYHHRWTTPNRRTAEAYCESTSEDDFREDCESGCTPPGEQERDPDLAEAC